MKKIIWLDQIQTNMEFVRTCLTFSRVGIL